MADEWREILQLKKKNLLDEKAAILKRSQPGGMNPTPERKESERYIPAPKNQEDIDRLAEIEIELKQIDKDLGLDFPIKE